MIYLWMMFYKKKDDTNLSIEKQTLISLLNLCQEVEMNIYHET